MSALIPKAQIARQFSRAAQSYASVATLQAKAAKELMKLAPHRLEKPSILELGVGTGFLTERLLDRYPKAEFLGIDIAKAMLDYCETHFPRPQARWELADAETFVPSAPLGLLASSFVLQWFSAPIGTITQLSEHLVPGGHLLFSLPTSGSLAELKLAHQAALNAGMPSLRYLAASAVLEGLQEAGLEILRSSESYLSQAYPSGLVALMALKSQGVGLSGRNSPPLALPKLRKLAKALERLEDGPRLSFNVLHVCAQVRA